MPKLTKDQKLVKRIQRYMRDINRMETYCTDDGRFYYNGFPPPAPFAENYRRKTKNRRKRGY